MTRLRRSAYAFRRPTANMFLSADATINAKATGAMSYAFISALKKDDKQSYVELLNSIRDILENEYSQKPQLSCSHPLGWSTLTPLTYARH